jgi:hypothetical protein
MDVPGGTCPRSSSAPGARGRGPLGGRPLPRRPSLVRLARDAHLQDARAGAAVPLPLVRRLRRLPRQAPQPGRAGPPGRREDLAAWHNLEIRDARPLLTGLKTVSGQGELARARAALAPRYLERRRPGVPDPRPPGPHPLRRRGPARRAHRGPRHRAVRGAFRPRRAHRRPPRRGHPAPHPRDAPSWRPGQRGPRHRARPGGHPRLPIAPSSSAPAPADGGGSSSTARPRSSPAAPADLPSARPSPAPLQRSPPRRRRPGRLDPDQERPRATTSAA